MVLHWRPGAGIQSEPPRYRWQGKTLNAGWVTTFNRHAVVSENRCTTIPSGTDPDAAALFGCAVTTGFGVVENNAKLKMGESVVVFGAGGIGLNIVQAAALVSAGPIIAVDRFDSRLKLASRWAPPIASTAVAAIPKSHPASSRAKCWMYSSTTPACQQSSSWGTLTDRQAVLCSWVYLDVETR